MEPRSCVILAAGAGRIVPQCERALQTLESRGYSVRRFPEMGGLELGRSLIATQLLAENYRELVWISPEIEFSPDDVEKLRRHEAPLVCGIYPVRGRRELACTFLPQTREVNFGPSGGLLEILYGGFGFMLTRRMVYEEMKRRLSLAESRLLTGERVVPWFMASVVKDGGQTWYLTEEQSFCERARRCQFRVLADTSIRLWHVGTHAYGWEDAGADRERYDNYTFHLVSPQATVPAAASPAVVSPTAAAPPTVPAEPRPPGSARNRKRPANPLREPAKPLPAGFPRLAAYFVTYPKNLDSMEKTLASFRESDWGEEPVVFVQPADWPPGKPAASRNYKQAMEAAVAADCDFAVILEDDVRVNRHLRQNLSEIAVVRRDQCDYLSLFMPDLVAAPWERQEPHLGYRIAKSSLYSGPNRLWVRSRVWGSQAYVLSRRMLLASLERWDHLREGQDSRILTICKELHLPMWYSCPCLIEHAPLRSAFGTPPTYAPDFKLDFRFEQGPGFQPPEEIPGWLAIPEARLLWELAKGRTVLELGTAYGRATVCLGQQAERVLTIDLRDQEEAREWVRRYGLLERVEFRQGDVKEVCPSLAERFELIFIDTDHNRDSVTRDIEAALPLLAPGGQLAFHDYPDPVWPDVRRVVDSYAQRFQWKRVAQANYLAAFQT